MDNFDITKLAITIIPVVVGIAKAILERLTPEQRDPQTDAAIALFNAMVAFLEVYR